MSGSRSRQPLSSPNPCKESVSLDNAGQLIVPLEPRSVVAALFIMSLLVVGSVAIDSVQTPTEIRERILGGSASYFSYSASFFGPVRLVGVVGEDFPPQHVELLKSRNIDTSGLHVIPGGKTFFWKGKYQPNMNDRETLEVHLNVFGDFKPQLPAEFRRSDF